MNQAANKLAAALERIAWMRPPGPTKNKMIEAMERIALDALIEYQGTVSTLSGGIATHVAALAEQEPPGGVATPETPKDYK